MTGTDTVYIVFLHKRQVTMHLLQADGKPGYRVAVMTIYTMKLDILSIEIKNTILNKHFPQPKLFRNHLIFRLQYNGIQIRRLRAPEFDRMQWKCQMIAPLRF